MTDEEYFGLFETLKDKRLELGIKRVTVAYKLGIDSSTFLNWENGSRPLTLPKIEAWAKELGYTIEFKLVELDR